MNSSITKRWVRGSLLFTLAVVLVAEGVFLFFTITGYYDNARAAINSQFSSLGGKMSMPSSSTADQRSLRIIQTVEQFEAKTQFELMLVRANGSIDTTSSGILPNQTELPPDIIDALKAGGNGVGQFVGEDETGEKIMAETRLIESPARNIVAMRLVTSLTLVDKTIRNVVVASVVLLAVIIMASVLSGLYFIRSIVFPLQKIEATAARIAHGDFDNRIANNSNDEIGNLCKTINNMAEALQENERMKNEFISSVSHELRTPLTSIKGWTETIGHLQDPKSPNFKRGMEIIAGETDRLYEMVEELLDFSRMQNGVTMEPELLDLAAEVEEAVLLSGQRALALGIELCYTAPELPVPVMADKNRIRQVMINVLDNAIKYSYSGGEVLVEILEDDKNAYVVIKDEGQGIQPDDLEHIKQKFYKGKGALRGSGIGLAVVDEIMQVHGGALEIASEVNRGTEVTLRLPLHPKKAV